MNEDCNFNKGKGFSHENCCSLVSPGGRTVSGCDSQCEVYEMQERIDELDGKVAALKSEIEKYRQEGLQRREEIRGVRDKYQEIISRVGSKFPGENRHQTACRYIEKMEKGSGAQCLVKEDEG